MRVAKNGHVFELNGTCALEMTGFGVPSAVKVLCKPVLLVALLWLGVQPEPAQAQQPRYEQNALSSATRAGLNRAGGGRVLSVERLQSGRNGLSRVKILDERGRVQIYVIEDAARMRNDAPFEREESGRAGRFFRFDPTDGPRNMDSRERERGNAPRPRGRSGDVRRDN